jgi:hypothetical protein
MNRLGYAAAVLLFAVGWAAPGAVDAQMTVGIGGGIVSATFVGDDVDDLNVESRTGFSFGGWLSVPLGDRIAIVPGASYVQKGTKAAIGTVTATFELSYIEIPVLFSFRLTPAESSTGFNLFAGPSVAFEIGCSLSGEEDGVEVSVDCDDPDADADERQSVDFGGIVGAGVTFPLNERLGLNISGGVDLGLRTLDASTDEDDIKNRAFFGSVALTFPVGG